MKEKWNLSNNTADNFVHMNHARGLELVQSQELSNYSLILLDISF